MPRKKRPMELKIRTSMEKARTSKMRAWLCGSCAGGAGANPRFRPPVVCPKCIQAHAAPRAFFRATQNLAQNLGRAVVVFGMAGLP